MANETEMWWAIRLDAGNSEEGFFYHNAKSDYKPVLYETKRAADRFLKHIAPIIKGKVVQVSLSVTP